MQLIGFSLCKISGDNMPFLASSFTFTAQIHVSHKSLSGFSVREHEHKSTLKLIIGILDLK